MSVVVGKLKVKDVCWYCGSILKHVPGHPRRPTRDHVVPRSRGGRGPNNYVAACYACNHRKKALPLDEFRRRYGGGLFWGELYDPSPTNGTDERPPDIRAFRRWRDMQATVGANDWLVNAAAADRLRRGAKGFQTPDNGRPEYHFGYRINPVSFVGFGFRWEPRRVAIYLPWRIVVVGKFPYSPRSKVTFLTAPEATP